MRRKEIAGNRISPKVNRNHKDYPVKADFKGISLSTSLQEHVSVTFDPSNYSVDLSN